MPTVLLLHGDASVARSLTELIDATPGLVMAASVPRVHELHEALARHLPDLLIVDLLRSGGNLRTLWRDLPESGAPGRPHLLALTPSLDDPRLMDALRHGADGYFAPGSTALLVAAVEQLLDGESPMSPQIARDLKAQFDKPSRPGKPGSAPIGSGLNDAQRRVLDWTAEGYVAAEVARRLGVGQHVVGLCLRTIYRRWQRDQRADLMALAGAW